MAGGVDDPGGTHGSATGAYVEATARRIDAADVGRPAEPHTLGLQPGGDRGQCLARVHPQVERQVRTTEDVRGSRREQVVRRIDVQQTRLLGPAGGRELLEHGHLGLAAGDDGGAGLADLEARLRGEREPALTGRQRIGERLTRLHRGADVPEVADRGPDCALVTLDDMDPEAARKPFDGVRETHDPGTDDDKVGGTAGGGRVSWHGPNTSVSRRPGSTASINMYRQVNRSFSCVVSDPSIVIPAFTKSLTSLV